MIFWPFAVGLGLLLLVLFIFVFCLRKSDRSGIWKDAHCVITGGSTGLGLAVAEEIVALGGSVTILARNPTRLAKAKEKILTHTISNKQTVITIPTDVTDEEAIKEAQNKIMETHSTVDFLFCCAGVAKPGLFLETPTEIFDQQMQLNYMGIVKTLKVFTPQVINSNHSKKRIILVSSAMGLSGFIGYSQYSATKFAVRGLAECLRNEFLSYGIGLSIFHASSMDSPGYEVEERTKPEITKQIEGTATLFKPEEAASHCLRAVEKEKYHICSEIAIEAIRITGNGLTPRNYPILETIVAPFFPLIGFIAYRFVFDYPVKQARKRH